MKLQYKENNFATKGNYFITTVCFIHLANFIQKEVIWVLPNFLSKEPISPIDQSNLSQQFLVIFVLPSNSREKRVIGYPFK